MTLHRCTISIQSGDGWPCQRGGCDQSAQVHCKHTVMERVASGPAPPPVVSDDSRQHRVVRGSTLRRVMTHLQPYLKCVWLT
jgi:hypothetical protein